MSAARNLRLQVLLDAVDRVSGPMKKILGGSNAATRALRDSQGAMKALERTQRDLGAFHDLRTGLKTVSRQLQDTTTRAGQTRAVVENMGDAHTELGAKLRVARQQYRAVSKEMAKTTAPSRALYLSYVKQKEELSQLETRHARSNSTLRKARSELRRADGQVAALTRRQEDLGNKLDRARSALERAGISSDRFGSRQRELRGEIRRASEAIAAQQRRVERLSKAQATAGKLHSGGMTAAAHGAGMAFAGQRVLRGAVGPAAAAMEFESAMADVRKVVDFETPQQFQEMSRDIQDLSMRLPMSADGIAQIVAAAGQANIARHELLRFAEDAARMGIAFDSTAEDAGQTMATWRTAFRMNQQEVVELADQVNYLGNTGPASVGKITDVLTRIGALGEVGGLVAGEVAALGATVAGMGIASEVSGTGIKNMILRLTAGEAATKKQRAVFEQLGLDALGMASAMQDDAGGAILTVLERLRELPAAQQNAAMTQLFGTESVGAIAPLLTNLDLLRENFGKVADAQQYQGSMGAEYAARIATSENAMQLMKNTASVLAQTIGETLLPDIKALSERVATMVSGIVGWARENPRLAKGLAAAAIGGAALVTVLGGLLMAGGLAAMAIGQIYKVTALVSGGKGVGGLVRSLGTLAGKALPMVGRAIMLVGRALLLNPIGLLLTTIAIAAYLIWKNWDRIGPMLAAVWDAIWQRIQVVWEAIKTYVVGAWNVIAGLFTGDRERVVGGLSKMWEAINTIFAGWPAKFLQFGVDMIKGLVRGITSMAGAVRDAVVGAVSGAVDKFKGFLGIRSPSRLFAQFGGFTMQGFAGGLEREQGRPVAALQAVGSRLARVGAGVALGAALPAVAAATPALETAAGIRIDSRPPVAASSGAPAAAAPVYNITINAPAGGQAQDIATLVRQEIERLERERSARTRSRLGDYD